MITADSGGMKVLYFPLFTACAALYSKRTLHFQGLVFAGTTFVTIDTDGCKPLEWARLHVDGGAVMFVRAEKPIDPRAQGIMLCMYTPDLVGFREQQLANGVKVPPIVHPEYMPSGELDFAEPDGFHIAVMHWGEPEQEAWEQRLAGNK